MRGPLLVRRAILARRSRRTRHARTHTHSGVSRDIPRALAARPTIENTKRMVNTVPSVADSAVRLNADRMALVELDPDHPGFCDEEYRKRRNQIAQVAIDHQPGEPVPDAPYTEQEHALWSQICKELLPVHRKFACEEYLAAWDSVNLPTHRIPQLAEVSKAVGALTGFRLEPVSGLIQPKSFFSALYHNIFLATQYIRHHSTPDYTPEPDVVHELIGHVGQLACPRFAALNRRFGEVARSIECEDRLTKLSRVYWFTIEYGLLYEDGTAKAYGAGLLSSFGELEHFHQVDIEPFDLKRIEEEDYDVTQFQKRLFCARSVDEVIEGLGEYLEKV